KNGTKPGARRGGRCARRRRRGRCRGRGRRRRRRRVLGFDDRGEYRGINFRRRPRAQNGADTKQNARGRRDRRQLGGANGRGQLRGHGVFRRRLEGKRTPRGHRLHAITTGARGGRREQGRREGCRTRAADFRAAAPRGQRGGAPARFPAGRTWQRDAVRGLRDAPGSDT
ncbi:hypothetical protein M885DRAFT_611760, partial [Pelagophyceae sp. CCMP2097]